MDGTVRLTPGSDIEGAVKLTPGNETEGTEGRPKVDKDGHKFVGTESKLPE